MKKGTIISALEWGTTQLREGGKPNSRLDAEILLADLMGIERLRLYVNFESPISQADGRTYVARIRRRLAGEPVAYIIGRKEFYNRNYAVTPAVLIPRPETECMLETAIAGARAIGAPSLLDLCTGSGAIAVTLAAEIPASTVTATDISPAAIEVARLNAQNNNVSDRVSFICGDLLGAVGNASFDMIVTNPPYIPSATIDTLQVEIRKFEPRIALDGGDDGLSLIRRVIKEAPRHLRPGGALYVEFAEFMGDEALRAFSDIGLFGVPSIGNDLSGRPRFIHARLA
jgi:release factor glutamine methyltransferase